jgi:CDP-glucose 4,6-dehydratase
MESDQTQISPQFWKGRRVFLTGHTGFKGGWLATWLLSLGARVKGYALAPATRPSYFECCGLAGRMDSTFGDILDRASLTSELRRFEPEVVFHLAAQPIVRHSYREPIQTFAVNVMGTAHVLEAARELPSLRAMVVVTSDKCYENRNWEWGYREDDRLGGRDPYSASKACAEIVVGAYKRSFFAEPGRDAGLATARAGNVIGGGDWSPDRLVPDAVRAFVGGRTVVLRNPQSVRPWQHVLEPLRGYLCLAQRLYEDGASLGGAWNFGPRDEDSIPVAALIAKFIEHWGGGEWRWEPDGDRLKEEAELRLDSTRAARLLGWRPVLSIDRAIEATAGWYRRWQSSPPFELYDFSCEQIADYHCRVAAGARARD